jgi:phospholipid/cholesterol/gamma-HCH transport system substrate-binding protein
LKRSTEFKVGFVVVLAIAMVYWGINFMQGNDIFKKELSYYAVYDNINGLVVSNPVSINGFTIGLVKRISFLDNRGQKILVEFAIKNKNIKISEDSKFKIFSSDLLGSKGVAIIMGESDINAAPGDTLGSLIEEGLAEAVNAQIAPLKNKAEELLSKISDAVVSVESILDKDAQDNLSESFIKIRESFVSFANAADRLDRLVSDQAPVIDSILGDFNIVVHAIRQNEDNLNIFFKNIASISDSLQNSELTSAIGNASESLNKLSMMIDNVSEGNGTIGKLLYNDSLYNSLVNTSSQLDSLFSDMQINPDRYIQFSVFGKKNKKIKLSKKDIKMIQESLKE